jgi:hypothetical protein
MQVLAPSGAAQGYGPPPPPPSTPSSQTSSQSGGQVVRVESGISPAGNAGNITLTGVAVDCTNGNPASRVAIYDGANGPYVGDVSMDTQKNVSRYCSGQSGNRQIGFTWIYDTHNLSNGPHTLSLVAQFPGGAQATGTASVLVDNFSGSADNNYYYNDYYGYGYGYGAPYGSYYGGYSGNPYTYYNYTYGPYNNCGYYLNYPTNGYCNAYGQTPYNQYPYNPYNSSGYYNNYYQYYPYYGYINQYPYNSYNYYNPYYMYYNYNPYYNSGYTTFPQYPYGYGNLTITLNQAGQSVQRNSSIFLSGIVSCSQGGASSVTVYDATGGSPFLIGQTQSSINGGSYQVNWSPGPQTGNRIIQVTASGPCGSLTQSFNVTVV